MFVNMYLVFGVFVVLFLFNWRSFVKPFRKVDRRWLFGFLFVLLFFLIVYWFFVPNVLRVFDEAFILSLSNDYAGDFVQSPSVVLLYHLVYLVFGFAVMNVIKFSVVVGVFNLFLLFYLLYLLFEDEFVAFFSPVFLAISIPHIEASTSAYIMLLSVTFTLLCSVFLWLFLKSDRFSLNVLLVFGLCLLSMARFEFVFLIPLFFVWWVFVKRKRLNLKKRNLFYWLKNLSVWILVLLPFLFFNYLKIWFERRSELTKIHPVTSLDFGFSNVWLNVSNIFSGNFWGIILFFLLLCCLFFSIYKLYGLKKLKEGLFLLSVSLIFFAGYIMHIYFATWFWLVIFTFSFFIFAILLETLFKWKSKVFKIISFSAILFLVFFTLKGSINGSDYFSRSDFAELITLSPEIVESVVPEYCSVLTSYAPNLIMGTSLDVRDFYFISDEMEDEWPCCECNYFFEDDLCFSDAYYHNICEFVKKKYVLTTNLVIRDERSGANFTLYKIEGKHNSSD